MYRGNYNLKGPGVQIEWQQHNIQEWMKCRADPVYFIEHYMKILDPDGNLVNFNLYEYQKKIVWSYFTNRNTITTTARQAGKSTTTCGFILWFILFNENQTVAILANKESVASEILGRVQFAYEYLPTWLQQGIKEWNKKSFVLENNSRVFAAATSKRSIAGFTVNFLFIDEAAHVENWDEFYTASAETISSGKHTKIGLVSTPNGYNHFFQIWDNAIKKKNGFSPIMVTWDMVPGRDEKWRQDAMARLNFDQDKFQQEHNCQFLGSSGTLIAGWKLEQLTTSYAIPLHDKNGLKQYHRPEKDHTYVCVCDVSEGRGLDYSAFQVIDITTMPYIQVCTFKDNLITPIDYAETIFRTATAYNKASVLVEVNNIGGQIAESLQYDFEYDNLLQTANAGRLGKTISFGFSGKQTDKGIRTTKTVKSIGCAILKLLVEQDQLLVRDFPTIQEFTTFSRKNKSYEAEPPHHDDLVMSLVLFAWLTDQSYFKELNDINTLARLREKTEEQIMDELIPFGFIDDGRGDEEIIVDEPAPTGNWLFQPD